MSEKSRCKIFSAVLLDKQRERDTQRNLKCQSPLTAVKDITANATAC